MTWCKSFVAVCFHQEIPHPPPSQYAASLHSPGDGAPLAHVGYINPAYSQLSIPPPSRSASLLDLNLDRISHKSSKWDEEDEMDGWDGPMPYGGTDSGLHSLAVSAYVLGVGTYINGTRGFQ